MHSADLVSRILDIARWAPSGDNAQPWRFVRVSDCRFCIETEDQSHNCIYELDGRCNWMSIGMLLETVRLSARSFGCTAFITEQPVDNPFAPTFIVDISSEPDAVIDPLVNWVKSRCVNRHPYSRRPLSEAEKGSLQDAVGPDYHIDFAEGALRRMWASIHQRSALLRLDTHEGWELMTRIIEWGSKYSTDRIPDHASGMPSWMRVVARRQMESCSWTTVHGLNRFAGGTWIPRLVLEWWPSICCAAHTIVRAVKPDDSPAGWLRAGGAVQRMWLTAAMLGLSHQPGVTPLVFSRYARDGIRFTNDVKARDRAGRIASELRRMLGQDALERTIWIGRIGEANQPTSRSMRKDLSQLMRTVETRSC